MADQPGNEDEESSRQWTKRARSQTDVGSVWARKRTTPTRICIGQGGTNRSQADAGVLVHALDWS